MTTAGAKHAGRVDSTMMVLCWVGMVGTSARRAVILAVAGCRLELNHRVEIKDRVDCAISEGIHDPARCLSLE